MKRVAIVVSLPLWAILATLFLSPSARAGERFRPALQGAVLNHYIVILDENAVGFPAGHAEAPARVWELAEDLSRIFGVRVERTWGNALNGFVIEAPEAVARRLSRHPFVTLVEQDTSSMALTAVAPNCYNGSSFPSNTRPLPSTAYSTGSQVISCSDPATNCIDNWGLDRIDQRNLPRDGVYSWGSNGYAVHVYVMDSGINNHNEFSDYMGISRIIRSINATVPPGDPAASDTSDGLGHGTHVAGILGGRTYGVAKDALLHAVKVCDNIGVCQVSWLITGFDHARQQKTQYGWRAVANLSANNLNWKDSTSLVTAVNNTIAAGIQLVQSAGNQGNSACLYSLGGVTETLVAGGTTHVDARWPNSNYGSCVDLFAPAADIFSAYFRGSNQYCELSGTSMAAPHVSGALALYLSLANYTPSQLRSLLLSDATNGVLSNVGTESPNKLLYIP